MDARKVLWAAVAALAMTGTAAATSPPGTPFDSLGTFPAHSATKPAVGLRLGSFHVQLEQTTLFDVMAAVGRGAIAHQGDAGGSEYWLCYTLPLRTLYARIWLSSGEMGGDRHDVEEVDLRPWRKGPSADCPMLPDRLRPFSIHGTLGLGSTAGAVHATLGAPSQTLGHWQAFNFDTKIKSGCPPDGFDVENWVGLRIQNGRVTALSAGQISSC